jgi:hypothetical protein
MALLPEDYEGEVQGPIVVVSGRDGHAPECPCPSLCQMVTKGEDE